jgi:hypothetical protein
MRTIPGGAGEPDPEDLRRKRELLEEGGHADCDDQPRLPRRWRPRKIGAETPGAPDRFIDRT